jgi:hypothetical protein
MAGAGFHSIAKLPGLPPQYYLLGNQLSKALRITNPHSQA